MTNHHLCHPVKMMMRCKASGGANMDQRMAIINHWCCVPASKAPASPGSALVSKPQHGRYPHPSILDCKTRNPSRTPSILANTSLTVILYLTSSDLNLQTHKFQVLNLSTQHLHLHCPQSHRQWHHLANFQLQSPHHPHWWFLNPWALGSPQNALKLRSSLLAASRTCCLQQGSRQTQSWQPWQLPQPPRAWWAQLCSYQIHTQSPCYGSP